MLETRYKKTIEDLREERLKCRAKVGVVTHDIETMLNKFNFDEGKTLIPIKELIGLNVGEPFHVNEKVHFIKQHGDLNHICFMTYVKAGGSFGTQSHDVLERCKIIEGHLIEKTRGDKEYKKGQEVVYAAYEKHKPYALVDSIYEVWFDLPKGNITPKG